MPRSSNKTSPPSRKTPTGKKPDILNLVGLEGPLKGVVFDRRETTINVGRERGRWKLFLDDAFVSQKHARIYWDTTNEVWMVQDRGSSNGTFLNLIELSEQAVEMRDGDILDFSDTNRFEVQISPCPEGITKREFFKAEVEIFAKRLKARSELQITTLLRHWNDAKVKILESAGYKVEHTSGDDATEGEGA